MKKYLLITLVAIASVATMHAYKIKIDNKTGKQGLPVRVELFTSPKPFEEPFVTLVRAVIVSPGKEKSITLKARKTGSTITGIQVLGLNGVELRKRAAFVVPQYRFNKDITLNIGIKYNQLEIVQKK